MKLLGIILVMVTVAVNGLGAKDVVINEFMAVNKTGLVDQDGAYSDWIELRNISSNVINLNGWYLTDEIDKPCKWAFPDASLEAGACIIVFASGKNRAQSGAELHANFKLSSDGEYLALVRPDGETVEHCFQPSYPSQSTDVSFGVSTNTSGEEGCGYFTNATPGKVNSVALLLPIERIEFSKDHGFYNSAFQVGISSKTTGSEIYYTVDGSEPATNSLLYTVPLTVTNTMVLRARAFKRGYQPTDINTCSYVFLEDVIRQSSNHSGYPNLWNGISADYEMDPEIVNDIAYSNSIIGSLLSLPSMSIVTDISNLFDSATGIYVNSSKEGITWERPVSVEWIDPERKGGFQINAGLRIYGGIARSVDATRKKTFRVLFKQIYGAGRLSFPLFDSGDAVQSFDTIILRGGANDAWNGWGGKTVQYIRDEYARRIQLSLDGRTAHGRFVHLYLNGLYWGLYNVVERPDTSFSTAYYGGEKEEWDGVHGGGPTGESSMDTWKAMLEQVKAGLGDDVAYQKIQGNNPDGSCNPAYTNLLDVPNNIIYMIANIWLGMGDWPRDNWYAGCRRWPKSSGFKFYIWDGEWCVGMNSSLDTDITTGRDTGVAEIYAACRKNREYCLLFGDYVHKYFFNNGALTPVKVVSLYSNLAVEIEQALIAESARWGDQTGRLKTPQDWKFWRDYYLTNYIPLRTEIVLKQLKAAGLYPATPAPVFYINGVSQHGGNITPGSQLTMVASNQVFYTLDGTDPRKYGAGLAVGELYTEAITLSNSVLVKARSLDGENWSALNEAYFEVEKTPSSSSK